MWNRESKGPGAAGMPYAPPVIDPQPVHSVVVAPEPAAAVPAAPAKARGSSLVLTGELSSMEDLAIEGRVEGRISLPDHVLTIGRGAEVTADITARVVIVLGTVTGDISAAERVEIKASGRMAGDLVSPKVQMSDGATFTGRLETRAPGRTQASKTAGRPALVA